MSNLVKPHGSPTLKPLLLQGSALEAEVKKAKNLKRVPMTSRETGDLIMMGIGAFTPLDGFMGEADWKGVCVDMKLKNGVFWPIPITVSASDEDGINVGDKVALYCDEFGGLVATMEVKEKYQIDKDLECKSVFWTTDKEHPGV